MINPATMTDEELQEVVKSKLGNWSNQCIAFEEQKRRLQEQIERLRGKLIRLKAILEEV